MRDDGGGGHWAGEALDESGFRKRSGVSRNNRTYSVASLLEKVEKGVADLDARPLRNISHFGRGEVGDGGVDVVAAMRRRPG